MNYTKKNNIEITCEPKLLDAVMDICIMVRNAGGRALLVGGCVRDAIQNIPVKDMDIECHGVSAEQIREIIGGKYKLDLVGMSFGVFKVHHLDIDIALPRVENKMGSGHKGFMVALVPNLSYADAAARRDFTINAIMYDPLNGELIDPWHGFEDIQKRVLRHVSDHFAEDPLRVLRAMQFAARFEMTVAPETVALCRSIRQDELPAERLEAEWNKLLLKGKKPSLGLKFLRDCGWVAFYPELERLIGCKQTPKWHPEGDVWNHTLLVVDESVKLHSGNQEDDLVLSLAALCHDFGKPMTSVLNQEGNITSYNHDIKGEKPANSFIARIWKKADLAPKVTRLVVNHMKPIHYIDMNATDRAFRRLSVSAGRLDLLGKLALCDLLGSAPNENTRQEKVRLMDIFAERANSLSISKEAPKCLIQGRHLIARGMKSGPEMGRLIHEAMEAQLDGDFTDFDSAMAWLDKHVKPSPQ